MGKKKLKALDIMASITIVLTTILVISMLSLIVCKPITPERVNILIYGTISLIYNISWLRIYKYI